MDNQLLFYIVLAIAVHLGLGNVNFALHKHANQSVPSYWRDPESAVDGNYQTCSVIGQYSQFGNRFWKVDLGLVITVRKITVTGRNNGWDKIDGPMVYFGNALNLWNDNQGVQPTSGYGNYYEYTHINVIARFVSLVRYADILTICEVTVEGDCLDGMLTMFCNETCGKCFEHQPCNIEDGTCPNGCDQGWKGPLCNQGCEIGTYGHKCIESCGNCLNGNNYCSILDGKCTDGCISGWQGYNCKTECVNGTYGYNCNDWCGHCLHGNISCSTSNGTCRKGCDVGWQGDDCKSECVIGSYGYNCNERCGHCLHGNISCSTLNGICRNGCDPGWQGDDCKTACVIGSYGYNCNETCGNCLHGGTNCSTSNGICSDGCDAGWQGDGCKTVCFIGSYGNNCKEWCGYCLHGNISCSTSNGNCTKGCDAGWQGDKCKTGCDLGKFGYNCNETCGNCLHGNINCSTLYGTCSSGCDSGWHGNDCKTRIDKISQPDSKTNVLGGAVGGAVAALVLIAGIVIAIFVFHRKRRSQVPSSDMPSAIHDVNVYENSMSMAFMSVSDDEKGPKGKKEIAMQREDQIETELHCERTETYYNVSRGLPKGTISLSKLWDHVQEKCLEEKYFADEFDTLPSGPQLPTSVALLPENRNKNRYKDLYAYDINRVVLKPLGNDENNYINASFIDGFSTQQTYIAAQGTTKQNLNDFWRMLWQNDVEKIVMLTGLFESGTHKCEQYWPRQEGQTSTFGSVSVKLHDTDLFADYEIRTLTMSLGNRSKRLTQYHFTAWPDKGVPRAASSVVLFWTRVNRVPTNKPIVVHCSAGIGRTGTYIALDILVNQGRAEGNVNVWACVCNLRRQRVNMVQTKDQYIFLHETLVEALMLSGTATTLDRFPTMYQELLELDDESGKRKLQLEYERLQHEDVNHETVYASISTLNEGDESGLNMDEFTDAKKPENKSKNRYDNILPDDRHRLRLSFPVPGRNDYINAVVLSSHKRKHGFILTQMPLTNTILDFWRMIRDLEVRTIVMLNSENSEAHDIGIYWPKKGIANYGPFSVRLAKQEEGRDYIKRTLSYSITGENQDRSVTQCQVTNWPEDADAPESTTAFLEILDIIGSWHNDEKPIVVHCLNGAYRSGLYCVISTVIERLNLEKDVAITQTIKRMREFRKQIVPNYEQFRFCHECIIEYLKTFETYANC